MATEHEPGTQPEPSADPERRTRLLWGDRPPSPRGKPGLTTEQIVRIAVSVADGDGMAAVSMRRVAQQLGVTPMSLYRHVPGKAELIDLMRDHVYGERPPSAATAPWQEQLATWARHGYALYLRHPWLTATSSSRFVPGPNTIAVYEAGLRIVFATGLRPAETTAVINLVGGFVESAARQVIDAALLEQATGESHEAWWSARDELYARLDPFPTISAIWAAGGYDDPEDPFEFGLRRVLAGIAALIESRQAGTPPDRDERRDEAGEECVVCGRRLAPGVIGRPRTYCSRACQQRAYRRRRSAAPTL